MGLATIQDGKDATITVDGVTGITSASNTVTNAIPGVTFQLLSTGTASSDGTPETVQVVIDNDTTSIETAINTFVTDYNTTMKAINAQEGKDSSGNPEPLYGTSVLAQLQEGLLSAVSSSFGSNTINSLISLGITANASADGTISLDADTLEQRAEHQLHPGCLAVSGYGQFWFDFYEYVERSWETAVPKGARSASRSAKTAARKPL